MNFGSTRTHLRVFTGPTLGRWRSFFGGRNLSQHYHLTYLGCCSHTHCGSARWCQLTYLGIVCCSAAPQKRASCGHSDVQGQHSRHSNRWLVPQRRAGITFLDPTRPATTRTLSPLTAVSANRSGTPYSAATAYVNFNGAATTNAGGANYSGLVPGPSAEDVRLLPDISINKTAPATANAGTTYSHTITPRNNGRAIADQVFAATQATDALASVLISSPLTLTDTLPTGVLATNTFTGTNWACSGTATVVCTLPNANAYSIAATTNFPIVTGTVLITCAGESVKTNTAAISPGVGKSLLANNTTSFATTSNCVSATLTITKTNAGSTLTAGQTTSYTITVANLGPGAAGGTTVRDPVAPGLSCTTNPTCAVSGGGAVCPAPLTIGNFQNPGFTINTFPPASSLTFVLTCGVTATGL